MLVFSGQRHWMSKSGTLAKHTSTFRRPDFLSYDWYVRMMQLVGGLNSKLCGNTQCLQCAQDVVFFLVPPSPSCTSLPLSLEVLVVFCMAHFPFLYDIHIYTWMGCVVKVCVCFTLCKKGVAVALKSARLNGTSVLFKWRAFPLSQWSPPAHAAWAPLCI